MSGSQPAPWALPYIDQPRSFWDRLAEAYGEHIGEVYFPLRPEIIGSGRPSLPSAHMADFLASAPVPKAALLNAVTLPGPVEQCAPAIIEELQRLHGAFGLAGATVANLRLAEQVRTALPELPLTASVLMDITQPNQALMLRGVCDVLVPGAGVMRHLAALHTLKRAFDGRVRLLVNEACLCGCPYRLQHFHEMCSGIPAPESLCNHLLDREPWMRLTGAWVTPQLLHLYDGVYDELKLAGRATLEDPAKYLKVFSSYVERKPLLPRDIGGGPASVLEPIDMPEELYAYTLQCGHNCHACRRCEVHYRREINALEQRIIPLMPV